MKQTPLSCFKGGSNTADNLQVLEQRANLKKGTKSSWWDVIGNM